MIRAIVMLVLLLAGRAAAEPSVAEAKDAARQVLIALRVLAYDKTLVERHRGEVVTVAVVAAATDASRAERARWQAGFALLPKVRVGGRAVRVVAIDYGSRRAFEAALARHAPAAVIVAAGREASIDDVRDVARARKVLTIARSEAAVRAGLAVAIVPGRERDEILINIEASRQEGARFGAGLLQLAKLVEERDR